MTTTPANGSEAAAGSQQVLTFVLGNETYGVDILRVQEIRGFTAVTKIPHAPAHAPVAESRLHWKDSCI